MRDILLYLETILLRLVTRRQSIKRLYDGKKSPQITQIDADDRQTKNNLRESVSSVGQLDSSYSSGRSRTSNNNRLKP